MLCASKYLGGAWALASLFAACGGGSSVAIDASSPARPVFGLDARPGNPTCLAPARPGPPGSPDNHFPRTLTATGCVDPNDAHRPAAGLIPYTVRSPLWSDGASKDRYLAVPDGSTIRVGTDGDLDLPVGSVLMKTFHVDGQAVETRLLVHHADGDWAGYSYEWNDDQSDATLLFDAKDKTLARQEWYFPSPKNCLECHTEAAGRSLGLELAQLNMPFAYPGGKTANQLETLAHLGLFSAALPANLPALPFPQDTTSSLTDRARSYLHANCANCHRPQGIMETSFDLRFTTALADTQVCNAELQRGSFGYRQAKILTPGDPANSMMSIRMHSTAPNMRMPQVATSVVDPDGVALVDAWISALATCP